jgi:pyridoxal phosphate enzyme (YggS family)
VKNRYKHIKETICRYEKQYQRQAGDVSLLAVSKQASVESIVKLAELGQRAFGENYLQEAIKKIEQVNLSHIEWHFIGHLQSNKLKKIAEYFDWVQTLSALSHAEQLNRYCPLDKKLNVCLQVNISNEPQKGGLAIEDIDELVAGVDALPNLTLRGLMAIGAKCENQSEQREQFASLKLELERLKMIYPALDTLSLGMSGDLEAAIAEGSTLVRIGTALFGSRSV